MYITHTCTCTYTLYSVVQTRDLHFKITKEDNRVHSSGKVRSWKICRKPVGAVAKQFKVFINKRGTIEDRYKGTNMEQIASTSKIICFFNTI